MKNTLILILSVAFSLHINAQDSTISAQVGSFGNQLKETNYSVAKLKSQLDSSNQNRLVIGQSALDSARNFPSLVLYKTYLFNKSYKDKMQYFFAILAAFLLLLIWVSAIYYAYKNALIKDPAYNKNGELLPAQDSSFSYSRVQLLWWTLIILTCYVIFFGATGVLAPLNITSVVLLGFGAMVYAGGHVIDNRQIKKNKGSRNQDQGAQIYAQEDPPKPDFISDILSDDNGISIHRFQAVVFNIVFGIGFIGFFINSMMQHTYPFTDFTDAQFSLLGISSATYLTLKASENDPQNNAVAVVNNSEKSQLPAEA